MVRISISKALVMIHECWDFEEWNGIERLAQLRRVLKTCSAHNVNLTTLALAMKKEMEVDKDWTETDLTVLAVGFSFHNVVFKKPNFL